MKITITGCNGRMGKVLMAEVLAAGDALAAGTVRATSADADKDLGILAGQDALGVKTTSDLAAAVTAADVIIDFTRPEYMCNLLDAAVKARKALVVGTTGLTEKDKQALADAAQHIPIVWSANMSVGVNLLQGLVEKVAATLDESYDIEIVEMHHRFKADAPSGTALALGEAAAKGRGVALDAVAEKVRDGITGDRKAGDIGFATLRGGDVVGDHNVIFAAKGERLELGHKASSRAVFAAGAVRAAHWVHGKKAGLYSMKDVLGL